MRMPVFPTLSIFRHCVSIVPIVIARSAATKQHVAPKLRSSEGGSSAERPRGKRLLCAVDTALLDRHASLAMTRDVVRRLLPAPKSILFRAALIAAVPLLLAANAARADEASLLQTLGTLGGLNSYAQKTSGDASIIIGHAQNSAGYTRPFRWTAQTGMQDIGTLGGNNGYAFDISLSGNVIIGLSYLSNNSTWRAYRWTEATGMVDLGTLGGTNSTAVGISSDGAIISGYSSTTGNAATHAYRWTQATGMIDLGTLGGTNSYASVVSGDGTTIVGDSRITGNTAYRAFRWTQPTGMIDLGNLGGNNSNTYAVSYDGSVVAGNANLVGNTIYHAFRWTEETGMVDIGSLGGTRAYPESLSRDGSIIVGEAQVVGDSAWHAFRWTEETGLQDLNTLFSNAGVDMAMTVLSSARGISSNNKYIVGYGKFYGSSYETAFLACYDPGENGCVGLTTASKQEEAAIDLASNQQIAMTESRSAANELMGFTRPMTMGAQTFSGAMFGSAMGYAGGQYTKDRFTLLGGLGYGAQDYKYIKPENSLTVASGLRYTFGSLTGGGDKDNTALSIGALSPFVEAGGWYTPDMEVALSRPYNNGTGTNRGEGNTNSSSWAEYVKAGLVWDQSDVNQFTAYGEIGRQHMLFDGYSETATSTNPFPATISDSEMTFNFARAGGSWTRQLDKFLGKPVSFTVAGAVAHSFGVKTNLTSTVSGVGTAHAVAKKNLWAEYGGRLSSDLTDNVALNLDVTGTTGNHGMGTAIHGGAGVSVKF